MSVENNIYRYDYGELNDVTPPATPVHRPASGRENALTTLGTSVRNAYTTSGTGEQQEWYGICLRVEPAAETSGSSESGYSSGWEGTQNRFQDANLVRIKVRIPEAMPALPEPGNLAASPDDMTMDDNIKVDNHPTFVAQSPGLPIPNVGDVVKVHYDRQFGQAIYLARTNGTGVSAMAQTSSGAGNSFSNGSGSSVVTQVGEVEVTGEPTDESAATGSYPDFTWEELETLRGPLQSLLDYIAAREGNYNSVNRGTAGDTPDGQLSNVIPGATSLTSLTIAQVTSYQRDGSSANSVSMDTISGRPAPPSNVTPGLLAVGKYQFVPSTLEMAVRKSGIPSSTLFNETAQERLGVTLLIQGQRKSLAKYLINMHGYSSLAYAAQDMAREWSSQPIQWAENNCQRGQSRYCGSGGNMAHYTTTQATTAIAQARAQVAADPACQTLLLSKGYLSLTS